MLKQIIILLLLISVAFSATNYPWENKYWIYSNPNIFTFFDFELWNFFEFQSTINSIDVENLTKSGLTSTQASEKLAELNSNYKNSVQSRTECVYIYQELFNTTYANNEYINMNIKTAKLLASELLEGTFSECSKYPEYWKSTVKSSEQLLFISTKNLDSEFKQVQLKYLELEKTGLCKNCPYENAKYDSVKNYSKKFYSELQGYLPNFSGFSRAIKDSSGLEIEFKKDGENALAELSLYTKLYYNLKKEVEKLRTETKSLIQDLNKEELDQIGSNVYLESIPTDYKNSEVSALFSNYSSESTVISNDLDSADAEFDLKQQDYLRDPMIGLQEAKGKYFVLDSNLKSLKMQSEEIVSNEELDAKNEIKNFEEKASGTKISSASLDYYNEAKKAFENGETAKTLGSRYSNYHKSAVYARNAISKVELFKKELDYQNASEYVHQLIENAKKDSIEVLFEENELSLLEKNQFNLNPDLFKDLVSSIKTKAEIQYFDIPQKRMNILELITVAEDLQYEIEDYERFFRSGKLDYLSAIGNLSNMETKYDYIKKELDKEKNIVVRKKLKLVYSYFYPPVSINEKVNISVNLVVYNPTEYEGSDIIVKLPKELESYKNLGDYNIKNGEMNIEKIEPYERVSIDFSKETIPAILYKSESKTIGNPDGSALKSEIIFFKTENEIELLTELEDMIDGEKNTKLNKGDHYLERKNKISDAYSMSFTNQKVSQFGNIYEASYDILIQPKVSIDQLSILIKEEGDGFVIASYSGEKISEKKSIGNGYYSISIQSLNSGSEVVLKASYKINNQYDYLGYQSNDSKTAITGKISSQLAVANKDFVDIKKQNEYQELYKKLEEEKEPLEKIADSNTSLGAIVRSRLDTLKELNGSSIGQLKQLSSNTIYDYLKTYKKDVFKDYSDLKKKALLLGVDEKEFTNFLDLFSTFQFSNSIEDGLKLSAELDRLKELYSTAENSKSSIYSSQKAILDDDKTLVAELGKTYSKNYKDSKDSGFEYLFPFSLTELNELIKTIESDIKKRSPEETINSSLSEVSNRLKLMNKTNNFLKKESSSHIANLKNSYSNSTLKTEVKDKVSQAVKKAEEYYSAGEYISSLKASNAGLKLLLGNPDDEKSQGLIVIGLTALLLTGAIVIYSLKKSGKKPEERFKKLKSSEEE